MEEAVAQNRSLCLSCLRPKRVCWCDSITRVQSQTRVVFLQHPREARVPISTCRMAHHSLPNSEMHIGLGVTGNPQLERICAMPDTAVLFPSDNAVDVSCIDVPPQHLVVVDGTWSNAKKIVEKCPVLSKLPRLTFRPERPGAYRIRKEPAEHCLATIEAVAYVLELIERAPGRFRPILSAFDAMVDRQLEFIERSDGSTRHKFRRQRNTPRADPTTVLKEQRDNLVLIFGEANSWPRGDPSRPLPDDPELVQLIAVRLASGERFERLLRPRRRLAPSVPLHLEIPCEAIEGAAQRESVWHAFEAFLRPNDIAVGWGTFCVDLIRRERSILPSYINVRSLLAQSWGQSPGSVDASAVRLGHVRTEWPEGRARRRILALEDVVRAISKLN